MVRISYLG